MKRSNIAVLMLASLTIACGVDVTDPQAGYFDDHQDKSGTQNFNNMGSGTMNVTINNNNQTTQPTVVTTSVTSAPKSASSPSCLLAGMSIEYIDYALYGTNLNAEPVRCEVAYRSNAPHTCSLSGVGTGINQNMNSYCSVLHSDENECITITHITCYNYPSRKEISSWTGNQTICKS